MLKKIVSGGQTGVDRAALDAALELSIPIGGWCPKGRRAEDGRLDDRYPLQETPSEDYSQRTEWNVRDSEGTLILHMGELEGGTVQTVEIAKRLGKPCLILDVTQPLDPSAVSAWVVNHRIAILNVAGPRESKRPGIYAKTARFLHQALTVPI